MKKLSEKLDNSYHVAFLNPKTDKIMGREETFQTLEELLGFLHRFEEEEIRERMFVCLMSMRDGISKVTVHRKQFHAGNQILRIKPSERFSELFWKGFEPEK